jgi:general secretion pathway protein I
MRSLADRPSSGFTLIEVLVALAIAALGMALLMQATGTGIESTTMADRAIHATSMAQSHLATVGHALPLRKGDYAGDDGGGFHWRVHIPDPVSRAGSGTVAAAGLYRVMVTESWRNGISQKAVSLYSERVGPP